VSQKFSRSEKISANFVPDFRDWVANSKNYKLKTKQKGMTPMNTLIKFSDALCHPISARRPTWLRGGFMNTTREQLAEIGRAFARGDKRTVDQACEELKATSLRRLRKTVSRNSPLNSWKEMKGSFMSQRIFNSNTCRILFATCLSALCLIALSTQAATITVINGNDSGPGSLRQALADANDGDTINFDASLNYISLYYNQLVVDKSVTISGPGAANLWVIGSGNNRVFYIGVGKTVTISALRMVNGYGDVGGGAIYNDHSTLTVSDCAIDGNLSDDRGGGIYNNGVSGSATLTINNSRVSGNLVGNAGGGIYNDGYQGSATLTINNSTLSDNSAVYAGSNGGAIVNDGSEGSATLTVSNSTLSDNSSANVGGGIYNAGFYGSETLTVNNSTISSNSADYRGGGIFNDGAFGSATLAVTNSTLSGNSAGFDGGGIFSSGGAGSATLTITNSTVSGNAAASFAGGIYNDGAFGSATLAVSNSTISGNSAATFAGGIFNDGDFLGSGGSATLEIGDTILKTGSLGANIENYEGTVTSHGYNLSSDNGGGVLTATGDQINTDPLLGPLRDNGGPTFTHELLSGSPAIGAGDPNFTPPPYYDQRDSGYDRVANGRIDIGAFEVQAVPSPYAGQVQQPINADGSSVFSVRRGVVPVKFTLTQGGVATCALPAATIAVTRTAGGTTGQIDESVYSGSADTGSNFRIDSCRYIYNLSVSALGVGTYRVDIKINGNVVGSAVFQLK
jgi:hypothetical protein